MNDNDTVQSAEDIRRRMFQIRGELNEDISGVMANARRLLSWKHYVRHFPKSSLAVAVCLGYLVIPRRKEIVTPDAEALEKLSEKHKLVVEKEPKSQRQSAFASPFVKLILSTALRVGMRKAGEWYGEYKEQQDQKQQHDQAVPS